MSYVFQFPESTTEITLVSPGDVCEFHAGFPASASQLAGEAPPLASSRINSKSQATLSSVSGNSEIALVLKRSGKVYARTNSLALSRFSQSAANPMYLLPVSRELTESDLRGYVPDTPFSEDNIRVTSASLSIDGSRIKLHGSAESDGWWFFDFRVTFDYWFTLKPDTVPIWMDGDDFYLSVVKEDFKVDGKNLLQDVALAFAKGTIRKKLEEKLEDELNDEIRNQVSVLGDAAVTVESAAIGSRKIALKINALSPDSFCAFAMSSSGGTTTSTAARARRAALTPVGGLRDRLSVWRLRALRDTVLQGSRKGAEYAQAVDRHRAELFTILLRHPDAAREFYAALEAFLSENSGNKVGSETLSAALLAAATRACQSVANYAGKPLQDSLAAVVREIAETKPKTLASFLGSGRASKGRRGGRRL